MEFQRLNTVFLPDTLWQELALALARKVIKGRKEIFHIDGRLFLPHLTIYSPEYPAESVIRVHEQVAGLAGNFSPFSLPFLRFEAVDGFVGADFAKTELVEKVHRKVVEKLNHWREGLIREKYLNERGKYSSQQWKIVERFGSPLVFDFYQPHLTLARFADNGKAKEAAAELNRQKKLTPVRISKLAVAAMGPNGTCTKMLKIFKLGKEQ